MKKTIAFLVLIIITSSCTTDFSKTEFQTDSISGFIEGGSATGIYGDAGLEVRADSITMTDWQLSRLVDNVNRLLDTTYVDKTSAMSVYTLRISNDAALKERVFIDSVMVVLKEYELVE